jgi:hypothetical protein
VAGLVLILAYMLSQWREIAKMFSRRQARYGTLLAASVSSCSAFSSPSTTSGGKQNKRWDLTANQQFSLSDQTRNILAKLDAPLQILVFEKSNGHQPFRDRLREYEYGRTRSRPSTSTPTRSGNSRSRTSPAVRHDRAEVQGSNRARHREHRAGHHERHHQGRDGAQKKVLFTQGHGEKDITSSERDGYNGVSEA